jgi:glycosyltransferase involved in cell wall biosynthesis
VRGPRVAVFHDAIALKHPELTPLKTVARFPCYLRELLLFDGIAAVSDDSRQTLLDYWRWAGFHRTPPVAAIPNAIDLPTSPRFEASDCSHPTVLSVGSIEGRKNHLALLEACEQLWAEGLSFTLQLIGLSHPQTGRAALRRIEELQRKGRPLRYDGPVDDQALHQAYAGCTFTVYPSLMEGFGLPVQEGLAHGKPCICSAKGAIGESAREGGCQMVEEVTTEQLRNALRHWLTSPESLALATNEITRRRFRTWPDYARELTAWINELPRRPAPSGGG